MPAPYPQDNEQPVRRAKLCLLRWILQHANHEAVSRLLSCLKENPDLFTFSGGVKLDQSIVNSTIALRQMLGYEGSRRLVFQIMLTSIMRPYDRDFQAVFEIIRERLEHSPYTLGKGKFSEKDRKDYLELADECTKLIGDRFVEWLAFIWANNQVPWERPERTAACFALAAHKVPNVFADATMITLEDAVDIMEGEKPLNFGLPAALIKTEPPTAESIPIEPEKVAYTTHEQQKKEKQKPGKAEPKPGLLAGLLTGVFPGKPKKAENGKPAGAEDVQKPNSVKASPAAESSETKPKEPVQKQFLSEEDWKPRPVVTLFDVEKKTLSAPRPQAGHTRYLGYVRRQGSFSNFYVVARMDDGRIAEDDIEVFQKRFPSYGAINLRCRKRMSLADGAFFTIDIGPADIERNLDFSTYETRTDYATFLDFDNMQRLGRVRPAAESQCFIAVYPAEGPNCEIDFDRNIPVRFTPGLTDDIDEPRLVNIPVVLSYRGYFYGPAMLREDAVRNQYVNLQAASNRGIVHGWSTAGSRTLHVEEFGRVEEKSVIRKHVDVVPMQGLREIERDVCTDEALLRRLSGVVTTDRTERNRLAEWIDTHAQSTDIFTEDSRIRDARFDRVRNVLAGSAKNESYIAFAARLISENLDRNEGGEPALDKVAELIASDPKMLRRFESHKAVSAKIAELRESCTQLKASYDDMMRLHGKEEARFKKEVEEKNKVLISENERIGKELRERRTALGNIEDCSDLITLRRRLSEDIAGLSARRDDIKAQVEGVGELLENEVKNARHYAFDGALAAKFSQAAAKWQAEEEDISIEQRVDAMRTVKVSRRRDRALADYLVKAVQCQRDYDRETVLNLCISLTQSFLTVLAGPPGSGKTSACNILGRALGLLNVADAVPEGVWSEQSDANRYLPISVERGWTSKRDFLGYYNPLTGQFETVDARRYEAFRELDMEKRAGFESIPYVMLLDEANLSSPEFYWGDFMNVSDHRGELATVSIGDKRRYGIPDTLRFLATMNSDHTTEQLSPRLIDRAMIVTLPDAADEGLFSDDEASDFRFEIVSWSEMKALFGPRPITRSRSDIENTLSEVYECLGRGGIRISPRSRRAVQNYVSAGMEIFSENGRAPYIQAIDYAVAQKILPLMTGSGDAFRVFLTELRDCLEGNALERSRMITEGMLRRGDAQMSFYSFF